MEPKLKKFSIVRFVLLMGAIGTVLLIFLGIFLQDENPVAAAFMIYTFRCTVVYYLYSRLKKFNVNIKSFIGDFPRDKQLIIDCFLIFLLLLAVQFSLSAPILLLFKNTPFYEGLIGNLVKEDQTVHRLGIIGEIIIFPITTEIFRAILINKYQAKSGLNTAIIASTILTSLIFFYFLTDFFSGITMALLYLKTRTVLIPILFNIIRSTLDSLYSLYLYNQTDPQATASAITESIILNYTYYVIGLVITLPILLYWFYKNWPEEEPATRGTSREN